MKSLTNEKKMKQQFTEQFKRLFDESGLSRHDIAVVFGVSQGTVGRWLDGTTAPHDLFKEVVLNKFNKKKQT